MDKAPTESDPTALLAAANSASEKVAGLHVAFMALCTYVLVIVFSTTDKDLLVGKGIRLPVVDVEVPILGFYAVVPYLLVLVHFNLLLQLQLLSRKLYVFDDSAPDHDGIGGLRDQLHIFPYTYYLIGRQNPLVDKLLALVVTVTLLLLPLAALVSMQARFLAYQSEAVTWVQRLAVWLDVVLVGALWPVIMDRADSWTDYVASVGAHVRRHWFSYAWTVCGIALAVWCFTSEAELDRLTGFIDSLGEPSQPATAAVAPSPERATTAGVSRPWLIISFALWAGLTFVLLAARHIVGRFLPQKRETATAPTIPGPRGASALLAILALALPLPLMLLVDGEQIDRPRALAGQVGLRHLTFFDSLLLASPAKPEIRADLRSENQTLRELALKAIEPLDLRERSLRGVNLYYSALPMANLKNADLQGANLTNARLLGARLSSARLQGAALDGADLENADLSFARFQRASLLFANLRGADLRFAELQGARLDSAKMEGVDLTYAVLQGADLLDVDLRGATMKDSKLQGANLDFARMQGADLRRAQLQGAGLEHASLRGADLRWARLYGQLTQNWPPHNATELVDVRDMQWLLIDKDEARVLLEGLPAALWRGDMSREAFVSRIQKSMEPGLAATVDSCMNDSRNGIACQVSYAPDVFRTRFISELGALACESTFIAERILSARISRSEDDDLTRGLVTDLLARIAPGAPAGSCRGLSPLSEERRDRLRRMAEAESRGDFAAVRAIQDDAPRPQR